MKNKKIIKLLFAFLGIAGFYACSKSFLDVTPQGVLDVTTLSTEKGVGKILLSAYAMLDGEDGGLGIGGQWGSAGSNFCFGSMGGGEANRGSIPTDQYPNMGTAIIHSNTPQNPALSDSWIWYYEGIKRSNTVLEVLGNVPTISAASKLNIEGQARFLRAWYHFQARIVFGRVPWIDVAADSALILHSIVSVANNVEIFPNILADAKYAYDNLPATQDSKGRINKWTAGAFYGKVLMFTHDYATAQTVLKDVFDNGTTPLGTKYALNANYHDNFDVNKENSPETVFDFQSSSQDGAGARNANWDDNLNTTAQFGGAGFFDPTYWFTNQFKTDAAGLPLSDAAAQTNDVLDPNGTSPVSGASPGYTQYAGNVDTRLDWTVGRNGIPFFDYGNYLTTWQRDRTAGPYAAKKTMIPQTDIGATHDASIWFAAGGTALNIHLIRFSDVMLMLAEADVEQGDLQSAFDLVNAVRTRAKNTPTVKTYIDPTKPSGGSTNVDAANYSTNPYPTVFPSADVARAAVRKERTLELGMEGQRFFDLVRWGTAATDLNAFYQYESLIPYQATSGDLKGTPVYTDDSLHNYYAIPQGQIDLSHGFLTPLKP